MDNNAIALLDCNNFYASCERVFDAKIARKPLVVLSNNDGCVVARSEEAKQIGVTMGSPLFKVESLLDEHDAGILFVELRALRRYVESRDESAL
jgi:DNA polymerase V